MISRRRHEDESFWEGFSGLVLIRCIIFAMFLLIANITTTKITSEEVNEQGALKFELFWNRSNVDIDLWVKAPDEPPVGYKNQNSQTLNLLRDDVGSPDQIESLRYEVIYARQKKTGEYIVNVVFYSDKITNTPEPVKVRVVVTSIKTNEGTKNHNVYFRKDLELTFQGEEQTVVSFYLDENKDLDFSRISTVKQNLFFQEVK